MDLIVHPEVEKLKEELSDLVLEYEDLNNHICPLLEHEYVLEFGIYEYELYKIELNISKLERKIQLIRIELNNQNELDINKIERILEEEFKEYEAQLKAQIDEIEHLRENGFKELSKEDAKKIKEVYRKIIKKTHPDLNPNQSFLQASIFIQATEAFKNGDLTKLESLLVLFDDYGQVEEVSEIDNLKKLINDFKIRISKVKDDYPYNKKDLLENTESGHEYKAMLLDLIEDRKEKVKKLEKIIDDLI